MGVVHLPVMASEVVEFLNPHPGGIYLDATVGAGGHAETMLGQLGAEGMVIGTDRDENALAIARERIGDSRAVLRKARFSEIAETVRSLDIEKIDGALFDLGVSMMQLKSEGRGFSFRSDDRLDMRMDDKAQKSAWEVVNRYPERELERILKEYGEEFRTGRIVKAIVAARRKSPINTCRELAEIVADVLGGVHGRIHPATKTFQAIRMEVNDELDEIRAGLGQALSMLRPGGRMVVIAYHSLEDRIVKNFIRDAKSEGRALVITKKPLTPAIEEIRRNPSSRSAKLRVAEAI